MRKTRNAIISSVVAIVLCIAMLSGSTFAWFTDTASSSGNIVQSGKFDVEMYWSSELLDVDSNQWIDASSGPVFTYNNWEPGYTDVKYIKVANEGELNLKWKLSIEADGQVSSISDVIDVYYVNPVANKLTSLDGLTSVGTLTEVLANKTNSSGSLTPGQSVILAIAFHMDEEAGNEYQGISLCDEGFSLKLLAAQDIGEGDAFGDEYDKDATWEETVINFSASTSLSGVPLIYGALANEVTIGSASGINATLPADVKIENGATSLDLAVSKVETGSNITLGEGESARSLDVHISGIASDNTVPMKVYLGAIMEKNLADTEVKLYHVENGTPVLMTRVNSVSDFAIHNQYTYDPATGEVTIFVASFSVFTAVNTAADTWDGNSDTNWYNENDTEFTLTTAEQFAGFRDLVDGGNTFKGKTIKLGASIDLAKINFDPIGYNYEHLGGQVFMGTFDGQGHTIYNLYQNGWELGYSYSTAGGGLFASIKDATIKNLAISGANIVMECIDMGTVVGYAQGTCHFENIVVTNSEIANYNRATGGVVGEVCFGNHGTDVSKGYSHTFNNITVDSSVTISSLWGSFDTLCGGVIGGKWGDATVKMENIVVAAELDVFSDVTAAYQWYAYRRCGMLIGHTEQNSPKQALNAAAEFLTCDNVHVYYGDWVNYTYYQFTNQDIAWQNNYPWVRAQEGDNNGAFSNARYGNPVVGGVNINTVELAETNKTGYTPIVFDQLYGGGQGVYGKAEHAGVTIHKNLGESKTIYLYDSNNGDITDYTTLHYWYRNGDDTWSMIVDGVPMQNFKVADNIYRIELSAFVDGFKITEGENDEIITEISFANLESNATYTLDGTVHEHEFAEGECDCGATQTHTWEKLTDKFTLEVGDQVVFVYEDDKGKYELSSFSTTSTVYGIGAPYSTAAPAGTMVFEVCEGSEEGTYAFKNGINYINWDKDNSLNTSATLTANSSWTVSADANGNATIVNAANNTRKIQWNSSSPRFACYTTNQKSISIYVKKVDTACAACNIVETERKNATCTEAGYINGECTVCGKTVTEPISALGHDYEGNNPYLCNNGCGIAQLPEAGSTITIQQALWIAETLQNGKKTTNKYVIIGTIDDKDDPSSTGATTITFENCSMYITNIHNVDGTIRHDDFTTKLKNGDTITVSAKIAKNDSGEVQLHETWLTEHTDNDTDNTCDICGAAIETATPEPDPDPETPTETTVSIDIFANKGSLSNKVITWTSGDVSVSNAQGSTAIRTTDADHFRLYANSKTTISVANSTITKVVITCLSEYVDGVKAALDNAGYEYTVNNYVVTVSTQVSSFEFTVSAQARIKNVTVTYTSVGSEGGETPDCKHTNTTTTTVDATCTKDGSTTVTCKDCGVTVSTETTAALGHTTENGVCDNCGETIGGSNEPTAVATFDFGANGSASHADGSSKTSYSETNNGYTLTLSSMTNVYTGAMDAKGNSCIKLGASSKAGSFSFTVPADVTKVVIYVAQYKANTTKITVNGTSYTITTASTNGEYTAIEIDTRTNKTVSFTTVSGGYRAMVNTIEFYK